MIDHSAIDETEYCFKKQKHSSFKNSLLSESYACGLKMNLVLKFLLALVVCLFLSAYTSICENSFSRGLSYLETGDYNNALVEFSNEIKLNPNNASAYNYRGVVKAKRGDFDGSLSDYDISIKLEPNSSETFGNRGIAKARSGDIEGAIRDFNEAILIDPKNGNSYFNHGMAMEMISDMSSACEDWEKAKTFGFEQANRFIQQKCRK